MNDPSFHSVYNTILVALEQWTLFNTQLLCTHQLVELKEAIKEVVAAIDGELVERVKADILQRLQKHAVRRMDATYRM